MNIVFDLGGVVVTWEPKRIMEAAFTDARHVDLIWEGLYRHQDWVEMDRGRMDVASAADRAADRTGLPAAEISRLLNSIPPSLKPITGTLGLIRDVRESGHRVFALSNIPCASIEHLEREYSFWELFDGAVISCRINMVKPDAAIFEYMLEAHHLEASETVFLDDTEENVKGARDCGIEAILFKTPEQGRSALTSMGLLDGKSRRSD